MNEQVEQLYTALKDFTPGDLVGTIEIQEQIQTILQEAPLSPQQKDLIKKTDSYLQAMIKDGAEEGALKKIEGIVQEMESLFSPPAPKEEKASEKEEQQAVDESDLEVLSSFMLESRDHLENIEEKILNLENGEEPDLVNDIFRSMHTIKGVASFIGLHKIKSLSHSMESVLDKLRDNEIEISTDLVDLLLSGVDLLNKMLAELDILSQKVRSEPGTVKTLDSSLDIEEVVGQLDTIFYKAEEGESSVALGEDGQELFTPEMLEKFVAESSDLLDAAEEAVLELEKTPEDLSHIDNAFRNIHTIKGNAGFFGYSSIERLSMDIESVMDTLRKREKKVEQNVITVILESIDAVRKALQHIGQPEEAGTETAEVEGEEGITAETGAPAAETGAVSAKKKAQIDTDYRPLGETLVEMGTVSEEMVEKALQRQQRRLGEILVDQGAVSKEDLTSALAQQGKKKPGEADQFTNYKTTRKDIRVDTEKLDRLFDLMGELITSEAMVIDNPDLENHDLEGFNTATNNLSKITREMQEITMTIRMIPLEGLFNKMRRLTRDLSRKFEKKINLHIHGAETEMDRNVMEEISDPLVHIIRNSIDHGIEPPKTREERGKEEAGNIWLSAKYEGNEIWITIQDDGGGLKKEKILKKAETQGILKSDPASMSDKEIWNLIFEPGFSTADKVSEISGRGVGMDVVKRNIEKLRGKIDISSEEAKGTAIILRIPLTLAIIDGISLKVGKQLFALPINDVIEFYKATADQITKTDKQAEVLTLRKEILPVIKLFNVYSLKTEVTSVSEGIMIVAFADGKKAALMADEIVGYQQLVVKALPEYMGDMNTISGCSIMGNGDVNLIIDTNALVQQVLG